MFRCHSDAGPNFKISMLHTTGELLKEQPQVLGALIAMLGSDDDNEAGRALYAMAAIVRNMHSAQDLFRSNGENWTLSIRRPIHAASSLTSIAQGLRVCAAQEGLHQL
jgi:hypothetical protein